MMCDFAQDGFGELSFELSISGIPRSQNLSESLVSKFGDPLVSPKGFHSRGLGGVIVDADRLSQGFVDRSLPSPKQVLRKFDSQEV